MMAQPIVEFDFLTEEAAAAAYNKLMAAMLDRTLVVLEDDFHIAATIHGRIIGFYLYGMVERLP